MDEVKIKYFNPTKAVINSNDSSLYGIKFMF